MTLIEACIAFFGLAPGQSKMAFGKEVFAAWPSGTPARAELEAGLKQNGYDIQTLAVAA